MSSPRIKFAAMVQILRQKRVPTMVQHCILKVYPQMRGNQLQKFHGAYNICAANFQDNGYLHAESVTKMTGKGAKRNRMHQREKVSGRKRRLFTAVVEKIFGKIFLKLEEKEKEEGV